MADWGLEQMLDAIAGSADSYQSQEGVDQLSNVRLSSTCRSLRPIAYFLTAARPVSLLQPGLSPWGANSAPHLPKDWPRTYVVHTLEDNHPFGHGEV
jgi:hypothetical protein